MLFLLMQFSLTHHMGRSCGPVDTEIYVLHIQTSHVELGSKDKSTCRKVTLRDVQNNYLKEKQ